MAPTRLVRLSLLGLLLLTARAEAGFWEDGGHDLRARAAFQVSGAIRGYKLTNTHGRAVVVKLATPADLAAPLSLPAGPWAELTLLLDGPLTVASAEGQVRLEVDSITAPLSDPDARQIHLEWSLPEPLLGQLELPGAAPRLLSALQDGAVAAP